MFHSGSLLVLPTNIRLEWKSMQVANTLAYYDTGIITAIKRFIVQAPYPAKGQMSATPQESSADQTTFCFTSC